MKKKKIDWGLLGGFIFVVVALIIVCILLLVTSKPQFTITIDGGEVNNLTACCVEIKDTDYFENRSYYYNVSQTSTVNYMGKKIFCFPEEQNLLGFDCNLIEKKDLDKGWFDENCEDISKDNINIPCDNLDCSNREGSKYKFGDYLINFKK